LLGSERDVELAADSVEKKAPTRLDSKEIFESADLEGYVQQQFVTTRPVEGARVMQYFLEMTAFLGVSIAALNVSFFLAWALLSLILNSVDRSRK
jgi:hypothetical protein